MTTKKDELTDIKVQMDALVDEYKSLTEEIEGFMQVRDRNIEVVKDRYEERVMPLNERRSCIRSQVRLLADLVPQKETKTQCKVDLLAGSVVIKKPSQTLVADKDELIKWATEHAQDQYIDEKIVKSFKWAELKKDLDIVDGKIINITTGEVIEAGVTIEEKGEEVVIK